jgi:putative inorganic carbon (HCO3(-)) transporter
MYWFILFFPLLIFPWGPDPYYTVPKVLYLVFFVFVMWTVLLVIRKKWLFYQQHFYTKVEMILSIFIFLIILSTIFSVNQKTSIFGSDLRYEGMIPLISYCSLLIFAYRLINPKLIEKTIKGIVIISIIVSAYGIMQHYLIDFLPRNAARMGYTRSFAFFDNPNFFGTYLVLTILLSITLFLRVHRNKEYYFYLFSSCLSFIAMIFSGTRSAMVGITFGIIFLSFFVILKRKELWKRWAGLLITFSILFCVIDIIEDGGNFKRAFSSVSETYNIATDQSTGHEGSSRFFIWKKSVPLIYEYFWLGSGPDTFKYVFPADKDEKFEYFNDPEMVVDKAHNEYIQIAVTLGVPALIVYLFLVGFILLHAVRALNNSSAQDSLLIYGLISVILSYLVQAFFNISVVTVAPLFWILLGLTYSLSIRATNNSY